jgi:hypothetical protein
MKKIKIVIFAGLFIIFVGIIFFFGTHNLFQAQNKSAPESAEVNSASQKVFLTIDNGDGNPLNFQADQGSDTSAFGLLESETHKANNSVQTQEYEAGIFIQAIGDKKNGDDGKYWLYYINGEMPQVSADNYLLKAGDKVEFKFEKSPF